MVLLEILVTVLMLLLMLMPMVEGLTRSSE